MRWALLTLLTGCAAGSATVDGPTDDTTDDLTDTDPSGEDTAPADPGGTPLTPLQQNLRTGAGAWARQFLQGAPYDRLVVEIDHVQGHKPKAGVEAEIRKVLQALCTKPGGVTVIVDDALPDPGIDAWRSADLDAIETEHRDRFRDPDAGEAVIWMFWADDRSARDTEDRFILGTAYHASSLVLYPETIDRLRSGLPLGALLRAEPEEVVAAHELGHLLGLVNNGIGMVEDHQDEAHGNHDDNADCLMNWTIEGAGLFDALLDRKPTFDNACLKDVEAAGGKTVAQARQGL